MKVLLLTLALIVTVSGRQIKFDDCGNGEVKSVDVDPCDQEPCQFKKGQEVTMTAVAVASKYFLNIPTVVTESFLLRFWILSSSFLNPFFFVPEFLFLRHWILLLNRRWLQRWDIEGYSWTWRCWGRVSRNWTRHLQNCFLSHQERSGVQDPIQTHCWGLFPRLDDPNEVGCPGRQWTPALCLINRWHWTCSLMGHDFDFLEKNGMISYKRMEWFLRNE